MAYSLLDQNNGTYAIFNHELIKSDENFEIELLKYSEDVQYYEIIRCIEKIPLFFEDHMERLLKSAGEIHIDIEKLENDVEKIIEAEKISNANIKIIVTKNITLVYPSKFYYPSFEEYTNGVKTGILLWERVDPNSKVIRKDYKLAVLEKFKEDGPFGRYFELLLSDFEGYITEGSRSNVFFTSGNTVFTAPDNLILKGITRKYVLSAIKSAGADLEVRCIKGDEISKKADGCFITGTSINVLPVFSIEDIVLNSSHNPLIMKISAEYKKIVNEYIAKGSLNSFIN